MPMLVPLTITTRRLMLRQFQFDDWESLHEHYSDLEGTKFTFGRSLTQGESWRAMASMIGHWQLRGFGPYAIVNTESNEVIGTAGLWFPNDWPETEIKWALVKRHWGNGYASEAVRALQRPAHLALGKAPISFINSENILSIKLAEAVGAIFESSKMFRGTLWHVYRHPVESESTKAL
jgi:RimJ/RimL family protein N-acetyltransferase